VCGSGMEMAREGTGRDGTGRDGTGRDGTGTGRDGTYEAAIVATVAAGAAQSTRMYRPDVYSVHASPVPPTFVDEPVQSVAT
jgi:hypothetical protein